MICANPLAVFSSLLVLAVWVCGGQTGAAGIGPVYPKNFADPYVMLVGDTFYAYSTNARGKNTPVIRSRDLIEWEEMGDALPKRPKWSAEVNFLNWAPGVMQVGDRFVLYYTTRYREKQRQSISYAVGTSPSGPFVDRNRGPVVFQEEEGGSIDPEVFRDVDDRLYLLWKSDANALGLPSVLYAQRLSATGRTLLGKPHPLLTLDQEWEKPLIENPSILLHDGTYYLIYSANWWESEHYAVGYATSKTLSGPYTKQEGGPILRSSGTTLGPGGASFFRDQKGDPWIAYHAWTAPKVGYRNGGERSLHLARVVFEEGRLRFQPWNGKNNAGKKTKEAVDD